MTATPSKRNCFDALRLALASAVIYGHSFGLGRFGLDPLIVATKGRVHIATDAVLGFFGISGYLISASWLRSNSVRDFLSRRVLRILPGFWACLLVTAFLFAPAIERRHGSFPFRSAFDFVWRNAALHMRQTFIGNVTQGLPFPEAINGSLWSLWPEFTCYLGLAVVGSVGGITRYRAFLIPAVACATITHALDLAGLTALVLPHGLAATIAGLTPYYLAFAVGIMLNLWPKQLILHRGGIFAVLACLIVFAWIGGYDLASPILLPWFLISVGESANLRLPLDISYGTYLYGFVIQQLLVSLPYFGRSWLLYFGGALIAALCAGWLSWLLVERHFRVRGRAP